MFGRKSRHQKELMQLVERADDGERKLRQTKQDTVHEIGTERAFYDLREGALELYLGKEPTIPVHPGVYDGDLCVTEVDQVLGGLKSRLQELYGDDISAIVGKPYDIVQERVRTDTQPGVMPLFVGVPLIVGRDHPENFSGLEKAASREHCEILLNPDGSVSVRDLGSTNHTYGARRPRDPNGQSLLTKRRHAPSAEAEVQPDKNVPRALGAGAVHDLNPAAYEAYSPVWSFGKTSKKGDLNPERHPENQDRAFWNDRNGSLGVFDGVGGDKDKDAHLAAEAAATAADRYLDQLPSNYRATPEQAREMIANALWWAQDGAVRVPGHTTATVAKTFETPGGQQSIAIASVGDSRAYLYRDDKLHPITLDDTPSTAHPSKEAKRARQNYLSAIDDSSALDGEVKEAFEQRNVISNWLGTEERPPIVNTYVVPLEPGDRIILTTDGIHDNLTDQEIAAIIRGVDPTDSQTLSRELVEGAQLRAKSKHARAKEDDMTAVAFAW